MRSFTTKTHIGRCIALCALFIFSVLLAACGSSSSTSDEASSDTGSISFSVVWPGATSQNAVLKAAKFDCKNRNVSRVKAQVKDENNKMIAEGPSKGWLCSVGEGTIRGVPVGANRKVDVEGEDSDGNVLYTGESELQDVVAGDNDFGTIDLDPVKDYTITATASTGGTIDPSGTVTVDNGMDQSFNIIPNSCYEVEDVLVDGASQGAVTSYTFNNVATDHHIEVTFTRTTYTITAEAGYGGTIDPPGAVVYCSTDQSFTIKPNSCYEVADVLVDGTSQGAVTSYTFNNVATDHRIEATFTSTFSPIIVGSVDTPGEAKDVYVSGDYAYVADDSSLQVIDVSDPENPSIRGSLLGLENAMGVYVAGDYAYVADKESGMGKNNEPRLQVISISDSTSPTKQGAVSFTPENTFAMGVYVSGDYAYVAVGSGGLQVINIITDSANPTIEGFVSTPGYAYDVHVAGAYAYVADGSGGLQVINISDPASPRIEGSADTPGEAKDVYVSGDYAYVADYSGLQVIDVSDPENPSIMGSLLDLVSAWGVHVAGAYAYVADGSGELLVIDITNPENPLFQESVDTLDEANAVYVSGDYAYVADGESGLQIIRICE